MAKRGISLALSSGGARGLAHVGVLKVLDRHRIPVLGISGCSIGGLVGALYCTGFSGEMIDELARAIRGSHWLDLSVSRMGLVRGRKLEALIQLLTRGRRFEDCVPPLWVVAVDIEHGEQVIMGSGPLSDAIRATVSIPGIFAPVVRDGRVLVDGGVLNRLPVDVARQVPDSVVLAVDVGVNLASSVGSVVDILFQTFDIMAREIRYHRPLDADLVVKPRMPCERDAQFTEIQEYIQAGEEACEREIPRIQGLLNGEGGF